MAYKPLNPSHAPAAFSVPEAADYLRISTASLWRLLEHGKLRRTKIGHRTVIRKADLDSFLEACAESA